MSNQIDGPRLDVSSLRAGYGSSEVLHGLDLAVYPGEVVAILGSNGAGKSTLVNTISGVVAARAGDIRFNNESISRLAPHKIVRKGVVQVPEGRRVFHELSVEDNLFVGGYIVKSKRKFEQAKQRVYELFPVLARRSGQSAGTLSGGEQQMLAMGRALCAFPSLLVLDEPSMGLAPKVVTDIYQSFPSIVASGTSVLLIEQNARKALQYSDRAYVLEQGEFVLACDSAELASSDKLEQLYLGGHAEAE